MHQNAFRFHHCKKCSQNFSHISSLTSPWAKLALLITEMARLLVSKTERKEEKSVFLTNKYIRKKNLYKRKWRVDCKKGIHGIRTRKKEWFPVYCFSEILICLVVLRFCSTKFGIDTGYFVEIFIVVSCQVMRNL